MPVDKRNHYAGTYQNGITSERYSQPGQQKFLQWISWRDVCEWPRQPPLLSSDFARKGVGVRPLCRGMLACLYRLYRKAGANPHQLEESGEIRATFLTRECSVETVLTTMPPCSLLLCQGYSEAENLSACASRCLQTPAQGPLCGQWSIFIRAVELERW